jgi:hypothetical protein
MDEKPPMPEHQRATIEHFQRMRANAVEAAKMIDIYTLWISQIEDQYAPVPPFEEEPIVFKGYAPEEAAQ